MFIYLSKKIAIPNNNKLKCIGWSAEHKFIACGGEAGLLKVLKLDSGDNEGSRNKGLAAPKNLSMNQSLEGHNGVVQAVCWNEAYQKLTSSDENGLIIVWMLYKNSWYEEMINNRNKSVVKGMAWTSDGNKICIVYDDGAVIVGSVDGNRLWGKELKGMRLSHVEWSPDARLILIGVLDSEIHVYDSNGNFINKLLLPAIQIIYGQGKGLHNNNGLAANSILIGIEWYAGIVASDVPALAVGFESGKIQLMRNETDESPIVIEAEMCVTCICWNYLGTVLAVTGRVDTEVDNKRNFVKFYNQQGDLIQVLKVPGKDITSCSWEKEGLRIALAVDSYIFFANIRPDYNWCYFASTVVFTINNPNNQENADVDSGMANKVIFWHIPSDTKHIKGVKNLQQIAGHGKYCVLTLRVDDSGGKKVCSSSLILCNAIGTPVDMVNIDHLVYYLALTNTRVIAASKDSFSVWKFNIPLSQWSTVKSVIANRNVFSPSEIEIDDQLPAESQVSTIFVSRNDPITCLCASDKILIIGQESGAFQQFILPNATPVHRFNVNCMPVKVQLNRDSNKLAVVDNSGNLLVYDFESASDSSGGRLLKFERKDVWDLQWASDNSEMLAVAEKTKLIIFDVSTSESEDPITSSGYICLFDELTVKTILLDQLINDESQPEESSTRIDDYVIDFETKSLRDVRLLLDKASIKEVSKFIEEQSHPKLWRLYAQHALNSLDLATAELAFVKCRDYKGIQFTKRIAQLKNDSLKRAEIYAFNNQFDEAESVYLDIDRRDLAIEMRQTLGDWHKVIELLKGDLATGNDNKMRDALCNVGDFYADNHNWEEAVTFYEKCAAYDKLFQCYCVLENYDQLKQLVNNFNNNHSILIEFGKTFESVGMCKEAVDAYIKARKVDSAINCCIAMSEWKMAIDLAHEYSVPNIDQLLTKYGQHLLAKGKYFDIVELYRKANKVYDATTMLLKIIDETKKEKTSNPIILKKLYTLIGLLYEEQRKSPNRGGRKTNTLNLLLNEDSFTSAAADFKSLDDPWKGAEAYHFSLLCQRQLYDGYFDAAMKTALHLREYEDFIGTEEIYCLLAIASCANHSFSICSKAFIKLESCQTIAEDRREIYAELAINIFTKNPPKEMRNTTKSECTYCETMISDWSTVCPSCHTKFPICIASGRPIMDSTQQWTCQRCSHHAYKSDLVTFQNCPLCHNQILQK